MMPLSGNDIHPKSTYNAQASSQNRLGSEEHIMTDKGEVISYEREFRVEESYIGTDVEDVREQPHNS
jgi:hypothetical protein